MFDERSGLSTTAITELLIIWTVVAFATELPTGVLADRYPRRYLLAAASALEAATYVLWLIEPSYGGYAAGFAVWGVAYSLSSGCLQAYLYDELDGLGESTRFTAIFTRSGSMASAGMVAGFSIAAVLGGQRYDLLLWLSIGFSLFAALVTLRLPVERIRHHEDILPGVKTLRSAMEEVRRSRPLKVLVAGGALTGGLLGAVEEYVPLYYQMVGVPVKWIPHLLVVGLVASTVLAWYAVGFERFPGWFAATILAVAAAILLVGTTGGAATATAAMLVFGRVIGLSLLLYQAALQHAIEGTTRATVSSLPSFLAELVALAVFGGYWLVTSTSDDMTAFRVIAVCSLAIGCTLVIGHGFMKRAVGIATG